MRHDPDDPGERGITNVAEAFDRFYQRHLSLVRALALAKTGDIGRGEDLTQETMLRAWRSFEVLRTRDADGQRAWLLTTLRHRAVEAWRRTRTEESLDAALSPSALDKVSLDKAGDCGRLSALTLDVAHALSTLREEDRELIVLRYFQGCDATEIGAMLQMPPGTVRRRLGEVRQNLARLLGAWSQP